MARIKEITFVSMLIAGMVLMFAGNVFATPLLVGTNGGNDNTVLVNEVLNTYNSNHDPDLPGPAVFLDKLDIEDGGNVWEEGGAGFDVTFDSGLWINLNIFKKVETL